MIQLSLKRHINSCSQSRQRHFILMILIVGVFMANLDAVMVNVALPTITEFFKTDLALSQWTITGYILMMTSLLIIFAKVSEYTGITRLYIVGWGLFTVSSLACGFTGTIEGLIIFRIIQGIGASMVYCGMGPLIIHASEPNERGQAMGYITAAVAGATFIGPGLGGLITDFLGWQFIFLINVPIGIFLILCCLKYLNIPEIRSESIELDVLGSALLILTLVSCLLACSEFAQNLSVTLYLTIYCLVCVISLVAFVFFESRSQNPLVNLKIFKNQTFRISIICLLFFFLVINSTNIVSPFYFENVMGYGPAASGMSLMLVPFMMIVVSPIVGRLYDHYLLDYSTYGLIFVAVSCVIQAIGSLSVNRVLILISLCLRGIGSGLFQGPNNTDILHSLDPENSAMSSSVASASRTLGIALGVSFASTFMSLASGWNGQSGPVLIQGAELMQYNCGITLFAASIVCIIVIFVSRFGRDKIRNNN